MSDVSPVLAAYLSGQSQQTDLLKTAQDILSKRQMAQNQLEERKQKQQELSDIMKRFDVSSGLEGKRVANETQRVQLEHDAHIANARNTFLEHLHNGVEAPQQSMQPNDISIPGVEGINGGQGATIPGGAAPSIQNSPVQTQDTPFGKISVNMPGLAIDQAAKGEQIKADITRKSAEELFKNTKQPQYEAQLDQKDRQLAQQKELGDLKLEMQRQVNEGRISIAEQRGLQQAHDFYMRMGIPEDPSVANKLVASYVHNQATGEGSGNPRQEYGPAMGAKVEQGLADAGFRTPLKGTREAVTGLANDASRFLNTIAQFKQTVKAPTSLTGQISNIIADKAGISGLSSYKSQFDALQTQIAPGLDIALGLPAGAISRSPKLYDKLKSIAPLPGDKPDVVAAKEANGIDLYLSGAAKKLSGLPSEQRKIFWQDIVNDHPEFIKHSKGLRDKLVKAGETGNYEPGTLFSTLGGK